MTMLSSTIRGLYFASLALIGLSAMPIAQAEKAPSQPGISAPELARLGPYMVGTTSTLMTFPDRGRITAASMSGGKLLVHERKLTVRMWYPAQPVQNPKRARYAHTHIRTGQAPIHSETPGIAVPDALPIAEKRFPLVVVSHGYGGWDSFLSNLTENLASKGYVVAAINHADAPFNNMLEFQLSFGNVLLDRAQDQRQTIFNLLHQAKTEKTGIASIIDQEQVALIGYSMGGFGAFATAGAAYDARSNTVTQMPLDAQTVMLAQDPDLAHHIKALVAVAPWGGQPANRSWTANTLGKVKAPVLMISGDGDDIVDYKNGVRWIFDQLTGADRHMLVYRNARHNVVGNPAPRDVIDSGDFRTMEYFSDPVWQAERINGINQHFITAFLDWRLKGIASNADYLNTPTVIADDGEWPATFLDQTGSKTAGADQPKYWRGFQRRWAVGLELHRGNSGNASRLESRTR